MTEVHEPKEGSSCQFCSWEDELIGLEPCEAVSPRGFYCVRPKWHVGDHVACGVLCMKEVWS